MRFTDAEMAAMSDAELESHNIWRIPFLFVSKGQQAGPAWMAAHPNSFSVPATLTLRRDGQGSAAVQFDLAAAVTRVTATLAGKTPPAQPVSMPVATSFASETEVNPDKPTNAPATGGSLSLPTSSPTQPSVSPDNSRHDKGPAALGLRPYKRPVLIFVGGFFDSWVSGLVRKYYDDFKAEFPPDKFDYEIYYFAHDSGEKIESLMAEKAADSHIYLTGHSGEVVPLRDRLQPLKRRLSFWLLQTP